MTERNKLNECLDYVQKITELVAGNEYEIFFAQHLIPIKIEVERQINLIKD